MNRVSDPVYGVCPGDLQGVEYSLSSFVEGRLGILNIKKIVVVEEESFQRRGFYCSLCVQKSREMDWKEMAVVPVLSHSGLAVVLFYCSKKQDLIQLGLKILQKNFLRCGEAGAIKVKTEAYENLTG